jgi:hypothetical protein
VQVPCDEGVAIHIGPESCAVAREGLGEALFSGGLDSLSGRRTLRATAMALASSGVMLQNG